MNKSQTRRTFSRLFESHEMSPLALLDLFLRPKLAKETGRFDTNSSGEIHKYFDQFKYSLRVNKKNFLSEYSSGVV